MDDNKQYPYYDPFQQPDYGRSENETNRDAGANAAGTGAGSASYATGAAGSPQFGNSYAAYSNPQMQQPKQRKPKKERKGGFGVTLAKGAAVALVFGLVAGVVFTGVSYAGNSLLKTEERSEGQGGKEQDKNSLADKLDTAVSNPLQHTVTGEVSVVTDVSGIVDAVMPSIVAITNTGTYTYQGFWGQPQTYESSSCGSGIIIYQDEQYIYIATNNHVVANADKLTVQFVDGSTVSCEIKGTAPGNDLAVVKVDISSIEEGTRNIIKVATIGDSEALKVGEPSIAIGNALGYGQSVTTGCISALGRTVTVTDESTGTNTTNNNLIQTDAAINPGNSGGALLNIKGEVIGINSVKYSDTAVEGIGYAIPMADAMAIIEQLITREKVEESQSAYLGIQGQGVSSDVANAYGLPMGISIYEVLPGSAAQEAGLKKGDIITGIDGKKVMTMEQLKEQLAYYHAGEEAVFTIQRMTENGYEEAEVSVVLGSASSVGR